MDFLVDTNILSELRKRTRADARVRQWREEIDGDQLFLSVLSIGEIRQGIENIRLRDPSQAAALERWLERTLENYRGRILDVNAAIADRWGRLSPRQPQPFVDGFIAATALEYGMTVATRNTSHFVRSGVPVVNPFLHGEAHD